MIICITGMTGAGKSTVAEIIKGKDFLLIEMGDIVRKKMEEEGIDKTHQNVKDYALSIREKYGKDIVARYAVDLIKNSPKQNIAISGVRSMHEFNRLKDEFKNIHVIAVSAPLDTRFDRIKKRNKPEDPKNIEEFMRFDEREKKGFMVESSEEQYGVAKLMEIADHIIENNGSVEELEKTLTGIISRINS